LPAPGSAGKRRGMTARLDHIDSWIFDLDNTLYPPSAKLFDLIDERMGAFIMRLLDVDAARSNISMTMARRWRG
jgi:putative hydrolase of the HAD superfamily